MATVPGREFATKGTVCAAKVTEARTVKLRSAAITVAWRPALVYVTPATEDVYVTRVSAGMTAQSD